MHRTSPRSSINCAIQRRAKLTFAALDDVFHRLQSNIEQGDLAPGHGALFKKADVTEAREFFEELRREVAAGMAAGRSLEDLQKTITLDRYKSWAYYDRLRAANIAAAYQNLKTYR